LAQKCRLNVAGPWARTNLRELPDRREASCHQNPILNRHRLMVALVMIIEY
jgi:hypothetical protein